MNRQEQQVDWLSLARRFRRRQLIPFVPVVEELLGEVTIRTRPLWRLLPSAVVTMAGGGAAAVIWLYAPSHMGDSIAMGLAAGVAGAAVLAGLHWLTRVNQIRWRRTDRELLISHGPLFSPKHLSLAAGDLHIELSSRKKRVQRITMWTLRLVSTYQPDGVVIAQSLNSSELRAAYDALRGFLGGPEIDASVELLQMPDAQVFTVSKAPIATSSASFRTMALKFPSPELAVLGPTAGSHLFHAAVVGAGLVVLFCLLAAVRTLPGILIAGTIGSALTVLGLAGLAGKLGGKRITIDRQQGLLCVAGRGGINVGAVGVPLADIAALQICSKLVDNDPSYVSFELNIVLREPAGERLNLISHADEQALRADAKRLAVFVDRPLLDHS